MFKKRDKKATLRKARDDDEGDSNQADDGDAEAAAVSVEVSKQPVAKTKKKKPTATSLLSFGDEEGEGEDVFTVKRSAHSRKAVQQFKARNHRKAKAPAVNSQVSAPGSYSQDALAELRTSSTKQTETEGATTKQEATEEARTHEVLAEVSSALISDGGTIPSAELIHLARKKRQMARSSGKEADFIPLDDTVRAKLPAGRLVREDDNDRSDGEDGLENRSFGDVSQKAAKKERQRELKQAIATDGGAGEEDDDDAIKRWEEQQMRSAASAMVAFDHSSSVQANVYPTSGTRNYFFGPALPSDYPMAGANGSVMFPQGAGATEQHTVPATVPVVSMPEKLTSTSLQSIIASLESNRESLEETATSHAGQQSRLENEMQLCQKSATSLENQIADASERYTFFQEMRGFLRDLLSCLAEKLPVTEQLCSRMMSLHQGRAKRLLERRKQDLLDECDENVERGKAASSFNAAFQHRVAEREGRRARRRHQRQTNRVSALHNSGMSSDDEELESDRAVFNTERGKILEEAASIFEDTNEEFSSLQFVCNRFEMWKFGFREPYENAYIPLCLSKLFAPFVHLDVLTWNPLEDGQKLLENHNWFQQLLFYGSGSLSKLPVEDDDDVKLIPTLVEKVILPKLRDFVEGVLDPLSSHQTRNTVAIVKQLVNDYPTLHSKSRHTQELFQCLVDRLRRAVDNDAYIPLYSKSVLENTSSKSCQFFHRQYWTCFKLFSNLLAWHELVSPAKLQSLVLDGLLNRYLVVALQHMPQHYSVLEKCQKIVELLPQQWFDHAKTSKPLQAMDNLSHLLASHLPAHIYRLALGAPDAERQKSRESIRQLAGLLSRIGHGEKSKALIVEYNLST